MIKATFERDGSGRIHSYKITGHADFSESGSDIVCAAVSAVAISTVNGIDALAKVQLVIDSDEKKGGYLKVEVPQDITQRQVDISQILLENLLLAIQSICLQYEDYIQFETINS
ncbi:MAG TPA: ribosomal-processing cysteine protease Prp [Tetragenococcus sp.]|nr:ribosomal-processing cysteine protease Prp [Tetragenococcus sp.]